MSEELQRIWDPLYGLMQLSGYEWNFVFTPEVQRLRHVRLCNIDSLLIPGAAQVSRFEHALGVLRLTNEWISTHSISSPQANDLRAAALVHDMQSGPFGHSIQYILEDNRIGAGFAHEDVFGAGKRMYHQNLRTNASYMSEPFKVQELCGERWKEISEIISGAGPLGCLIAGAVDFDNIDNVVRLAFHVGLCDDADRALPIKLARAIAPAGPMLELSVRDIPLMARWQEIRRLLYGLLLLDWAEFAAKAMLTRAFEDATRLEKVGIDNWRMTDDELTLHFLNQVGEGQSIKELTRRLRLGQLYTPVLIGRSTATQVYKKLNLISSKRAIEKAIRKSVFLDRAGPQILLHFILDSKKTERAIKFLVKETRAPMTLGTDVHRLLVGVFTSSPVNSKDHASLQNESLRVLANYGCTDVELIDDPLAGPQKVEPQLSFL
jgi:HD superfamily phosphohydrolase